METPRKKWEVAIEEWAGSAKSDMASTNWSGFPVLKGQRGDRLLRTKVTAHLGNDHLLILPWNPPEVRS